MADEFEANARALGLEAIPSSKGGKEEVAAGR
jgi:hypothetical protein